MLLAHTAFRHARAVVPITRVLVGDSLDHLVVKEYFFDNFLIFFLILF